MDHGQWASAHDAGKIWTAIAAVGRRALQGHDIEINGTVQIVPLTVTADDTLNH
jgi:hypothetical protein